MKRPLRLVVIGGVAAGPKAASKARREDPAMDITIVTDEPFMSYGGCGLAFYAGGVITDRDALFARSPREFREKYGMQVLLEHRAERINTYDRVVRVTDLPSGETRDLPYDRCLVATGASPVIPVIPGISGTGVFPLHHIPDAEAIRHHVSANNVRTAGIMGAGYIGLEMAESLLRLGVQPTVYELKDQVLPVMLDADMAAVVQEHVETRGVTVRTGSPVEEVTTDAAGAVNGLKTGDERFECGMVVVTAGVRPNVELAKDARITIGPTGAIAVDTRMETSVRGIYAAGDCAESVHMVTGKPAWLPLGSTANKQGRVAGINIAGGNATFPGIAGTSIVKIFDLAVGKTGLSETEARSHAYNPVSVRITTPTRAHYFPGGSDITVKLTADRGTGKLLGIQAAGEESVDKVIDTVAALLRKGGTVDDAAGLDIAYSPPYATPMGTVLVAAQLLEDTL